jgi:hypothetical protein
LNLINIYDDVDPEMHLAKNPRMPGSFDPLIESSERAPVPFAE